jgi:formylglycine-generating enzyme required for sulfatase activity
VIEDSYRIGAYPVTNRQFAPFVEAGGYERRECWSDEGWAWRTGTYDSKAPDWLRDWLKDRPPQRRDRPFWWGDERLGSPLCPVVGVSWFEAEAYCNWLAQQLRVPGSKLQVWRGGKLETLDLESETVAVRLPTEEEWERAVRGTAGAEYPWGGKWDRFRLNCAEWWAGRELPEFDDLRKWWDSEGFKEASPTPTAVVAFPEGVNPAGLWDGGGNVWEWTRSWYSEGEQRVLRGGSWYDGRRNARCAYRSRRFPDFYDHDVGFRVVFPGAF